MRYLLFLILTLSSIVATAQDSIPSYSFTLNSLISNKGTVPFWLVYGRNGKVLGNEKFETFLTADVHIPLYFGEKWKVEGGIQGIARNEIDESNLQEAYLNLCYGSFELRAGKQEYTLSQYSDELGSGSYYLSNNARPVPRVGIGFYDYVDVPFTDGYLQVRGFLNQGILNDDRGPEGTDRPLFHEKAAYIRSHKLPVNLHLGLNHSALFGGTRPDGTEIPIDYVSVFFGKGSEKVGEAFPGEQVNVAGAHLGLFDIGLNFKAEHFFIQGYFQKPFKDGSGFHQFFENNQDHLFGLVIQNTDENSWIQEIVYENMTTMWQSGPGAVDPVVNGQRIYPGDIEDYDQFILDEYGIAVEDFTLDDFMEFIERVENYGFNYGGRDNYYNNYLYRRGWSYWGNSLGTPVFLSDVRVKSFNPNFDDTYDLYFVNTRVKMQHLGVRGQISPNWNYKFKYTYTRNYGTYQGLNKGNYQWDSTDPLSTYDYFFEEKKPQSYLLLETKYSTKSGLNYGLSLGYDYGSLYRSFGALLGISYSGNFKLQSR